MFVNGRDLMGSTVRVLIILTLLAVSLAVARPGSGQADESLNDRLYEAVCLDTGNYLYANNVAEWLKLIGLEKYEDIFKRHEITLPIIRMLTDSHLREIGVETIGARLRILNAKEKCILKKK
jgi:hypothetical protein